VIHGTGSIFWLWSGAQHLETPKRDTSCDRTRFVAINVEYSKYHEKYLEIHVDIDE
jgi:hypothetical protein